MNEIPKLEGLTPQPKLQPAQQARPAGEVAQAAAPGRAAPGDGPMKKPPTEQAAGMRRAQVEDLAQGLQELVQSVHRQLNFKVDEGTETMVIQVIDAETEEVVRQIPPEGILELQQRMAEIRESGGKADASVMDGMLFNTKA